MDAIERIVVGLDLEPDGADVTAGTQRAFQDAKWIAAHSGATVALFHSTARDEYWDPLGENWVIVGHGVPAGGREAFERMLAELGEAGIEAELHETDEAPWLAITREAVRERADLVVVGKRSMSEQDGRRLGQVSKRLLRKCPCPVWVTKAGHPGPIGSIGPIRTIVAATDLRPVGDRVLDHAGWLARELEAELHVVHAVPLAVAPDVPLDSGAAFLPDLETAVDTAREVLAGKLEWADPENVHAHVVPKTAYDAIRDAITEFDADLLVLGTLSRSGISGFLIGNTAESILDHVDCSVLAVKPQGFVSPVELPAEG